MASSPPPKQKPVRWRPSALPLATLVTVGFLAIAGVIGYRVSAGEDPALGAGAKAQVTQPTTSGDDSSGATQDGTGSAGGDDAGAYDDDQGSYGDDDGAGAFGDDDGQGSYGDDGSGSSDDAAPSAGANQSQPANPSTGTSGG